MLWIAFQFLLTNSCHASSWHIVLSCKNTSLGRICVLCASLLLLSSSSHLHSCYYSVIYGVAWRVLMRFRNVSSYFRTFSIWCWACALISVKFNCHTYKTNKKRRSPWSLWPVPKFHNSKQCQLLKSKSILLCFSFCSMCLVHTINVVSIK